MGSYSPEFTRGDPDPSILKQLQLLSESIYSEQSKEFTQLRIASKASKEMLMIIEMQKQLKQPFDFNYLQKCL